MLVFLYSRKSKFTGKGESIENQIQMCTEYVRQRIPGGGQAEIVAFEDEGFSGKNLDRPQFQRMMEQSRSSKVDYIVCYRLDRISRSVNDFSALIEELNARRISLICIREQFDTSTPMGKAMMYIASVFAQLERETIAERIRDNLYLLARTGRWLGGVTPLGYRSQKEELVCIDGKARTACRLVAEPQEMELYLLICDVFMERRSLSGTARYLYQRGIRTRRGNNFSAQVLREILSNPVYCAADQEAYQYFDRQHSDICFEREAWDGRYGILAYNRTSHSLPNQGKTSAADWIIAIGRHRPALSGSRWMEIQGVLQPQGDRARCLKRRALRADSPALLSGLLRCAGCGGLMRPHLHSRRLSGDGTPAYYYICEEKERSGGQVCSMKNAAGGAADGAVLRQLCTLGPLEGYLLDGLSGLRHGIGQGTGRGSGRRAALERAYDRQQGMIRRLILALAEEPDAGAAGEIRAQIDALHAQCRHLEGELGGPDAQSGGPEDSALLEAAVAGLDEPGKILASMPVPAKKELLRSVIDHIDWDGEGLRIHLLGQPPAP